MRTRQRRYGLPSVVALCVLLVATHAPKSLAQDFSYFREEAPETLFGFSIGDAEVEFFVSGSWKTAVAGVFGVAFHPPFDIGGDTTTVPYSVPGFADPFLTNQTNVALTVLILEQFFLDAAFVEPLILSSLVGGYLGSETDFLQYLAVGYDQFSFGPYSFLNLGGSRGAGPGAEAVFVGDRTDYEFALRIEESESVRRSFRGTREVFETTIDPRTFKRGTLFVLPDSDVDDLRLYVQDSSGTPAQLADGSPSAERYRRVDADREAIVDTAAGTIFLPTPATGQLAVSYTVDGASVGTDPTNGQNAVFGLTNGAPDPAIPIDFSFSGADFDDLMQEVGRSASDLRRIIESRTALVLYTPGYYSPFESLALYEAPPGTDDQAEISVEYRRGANAEAAPAPQAFVDELFSQEDQSIIRVGNPDRGLRDFANRYPFLRPTDDFPAGHPSLYDVDGPSPIPLRVVVTSLGPADGLTVGDEVLPGTLQVYRNGILDPGAGIREGTGEVFFAGDLGAGERVELRYQTAGGAGGSDVVFGAAGRYAFAPTGTLSFGAGLRWRLSPELYATEPDERQGAVLAGAGIDWSGGPARVEGDLSFAFRHPNSTGLLSLAAMNGARRSPATRASVLAPAARPDAALAGTGALSPGMRSPPPYRDYRSGSVYADIATTPVPETVAGAAGPYVAAAAGLEGRVWVSEFTLDSAGAWQATRLGLSSDVAPPTGLELSWRLDGGAEAAAPDTANLESYIDVGAIGDDADGDGQLDQEGGAAAGGYDFGTLTVPGDPETIDGEDLNGNGVLDDEVPARIIRRLVSAPGASSFEREVLRFTPAERSLLAQELRAIRITVVNRGSTAVAGRLVVGEVVLTGSALRIVADDPAAAVAREVDLEREGIPDAAAAGEEGRILSLSNPGRVLELSTSSAGRVSVVADQTRFRAGDYGRISFFVRPVTADPGDALLFFAAPFGPEAATLTAGEPVYLARVPMPEAGQWSRVDVDLGTGDITIDGVSADAEAVEYLGFAGERAGTLPANRQVAVVAVGLESGGNTKVYIDEIYAAEARGLATVNLNTLSTIGYQGDLVSAGGFPLLSSPTLTLRADAALPFAQSGASASLGADLAATVLAVRSGLRIDGELRSAADTPAEIRALGHSFALPALPSPVIAQTRFLRLYGDEPAETSQLDVSVRVPAVLGAQISASVRTDDSLQTRSWAGNITPTFSGVPITGEAAVALSQKSGASVDVNRPYADAWLETFPDFFSSAGVAERERRVEARLDTALDFPGLTLSSLVAARSGSDVRGSATSGVLNLGVSVALQDAGVNFGLDYTRDHSLGEGAVRVADGTTFWDDVETWVDRTTEFSFLTAPLPVVDLFSDNFGAAFRSATTENRTASFAAAGGLFVTRRIGTSPWDAVVPSALRLGWRRGAERNEDSVATEQEFRLSFTTIAANVLGTLGQAPVFVFYETDNISNRVGLDIAFEGTDGVVPASADLSIRTAISIDGPRRDDIGEAAFVASLENDLSVGIVSGTVVEAATVALAWRTKPPNLFGIEETAFLFESDGYLEHRERVEVSGRSVPSNIESSIWQITLDHTTALVVPELGEIAVSGALSLGGRPLILETGRDMLTFIGFRVVLSGELRF